MIVLRWLLLDLPAWFMIVFVRMYQWTLSPIVGRQCRFYPTCSNYFILAVRKYGPWRGAAKGVWRICRCNPFTPGGEDWP
jgi:putative membrane protein insertion efficiency factor